MPCYDSRNENVQYVYEDKKVNGLTALQFDAILCGILQYYGRVQICNNVDWAGVGVRKEAFLRWVELHNAEDLRKKKEAARKKAQTEITERALLRKLKVKYESPK